MSASANVVYFINIVIYVVYFLRLVTEREKQLLQSRQYNTLLIEQKIVDTEIDAKVSIYRIHVLTHPYLTNGFSSRYHLGESTFSFRGVRSDFYFLSHFSMKFLCANRIAPDGMPQNAASHLGLYCLPMSHKRDTWLI